MQSLNVLDCSDDDSIPCCYSQSGGPHKIAALPSCEKEYISASNFDDCIQRCMVSKFVMLQL